MKIYIYYLIDQRTNLPFYAGATKNLKERQSAHRIRYRRTRGVEPLFIVHKEVYSFEDANIEELQLTKKLREKYGVKIINKTKAQIHHSWKKEAKEKPKRIHAVHWIYLSKEMKDKIYSTLSDIECRLVSKASGKSFQYIKLLSYKKPDRINKKIYDAIIYYKTLPL